MIEAEEIPGRNLSPKTLEAGLGQPRGVFTLCRIDLWDSLPQDVAMAYRRGLDTFWKGQPSCLLAPKREGSVPPPGWVVWLQFSDSCWPSLWASQGGLGLATVGNRMLAPVGLGPAPVARGL